MQDKLGILFIICFTLQINQLLAGNAETDETCSENKKLEVPNTHRNSTCKRVKVRNDYTHTPGIGNHKFHTQAKTWNEARRVCFGEGGHLAIINSKEEEKVLLSILAKNEKNVRNTIYTHKAFVGVHSQLELNEWITVRNEPYSSIGFNGWSYGHPSSLPTRRCAVLWRGYTGMDTTGCTDVLAFFCEIPDKCS